MLEAIGPPSQQIPRTISTLSPPLLCQQGRLWCLLLPTRTLKVINDCPPQTQGSARGVTYVTSQQALAQTPSLRHLLPWIPEPSPPGSPPSSADATLNLGLEREDSEGASEVCIPASVCWVSSPTPVGTLVLTSLEVLLPSKALWLA